MDRKMTVTVSYLQMLRRPESLDLTPPREGLTVVRASSPTVPYYRFLYNTVGEPWLWVDRRKLSDQELAPIIQDPAVEIYVLSVDGSPAGFAELDLRKLPDVEIAYFGIMPGFIGRGLGPYLLRWAIERAWSRTPAPARLWLHTCTLDHPKASDTYRRAGFEIYDSRIEIQDDPRPL